MNAEYVRPHDFPKTAWMVRRALTVGQIIKRLNCEGFRDFVDVLLLLWHVHVDRCIRSGRVADHSAIRGDFLRQWKIELIPVTIQIRPFLKRVIPEEPKECDLAGIMNWSKTAISKETTQIHAITLHTSYVTWCIVSVSKSRQKSLCNPLTVQPIPMKRTRFLIWFHNKHKCPDKSTDCCQFIRLHLTTEKMEIFSALVPTTRKFRWQNCRQTTGTHWVIYCIICRCGCSQ